MSDTSLPLDKPGMRRCMSARRIEAFAQNPDAPQALCKNVLKYISFPPHGIIAGYIARAAEMDVAPLMAALAAQGYSLALPVITGRDTALTFRLYKPGDALVLGKMGIPEPLAAAPMAAPDVLLVPLLAFDRARNRLGAGGGYYDRTFAALQKNRPILGIGIGFSCQETLSVPIDAHDVQLDRIATEIEVF